MEPAYAVRTAPGPIRGSVSLPGSKSYTNRALLIAALADGTSTISEALFSDDTYRMSDCLRRLGVRVEADEAARTFRVEGCGGRFPVRSATLNAGNSGTTARFLAPALAASGGTYLLDGDARMRTRPIQPLLDALERLGAGARAVNDDGCPPVEIQAGEIVGGPAWIDASRSSQFASALLLAGPVLARGIDLTLRGHVVSAPFVDMTAASMADFGVRVERPAPSRYVVPAGQHYVAREYRVEPDATAASYFFAAAAVTGGKVRVEGIGAGSAQGDLAFVDVLERMGCAVVKGSSFVEVTGPAELTGVDVDMGGISDTALTLSAIAPLASGQVRITGIAHTRAQESDRVAAAVTELRRVGADVEELPDGLVVSPARDRLHGASIRTYGDHRVAMAFAVLGLVVPGIVIEDPACVAKTFPDFFERLEGLVGLSS